MSRKIEFRGVVYPSLKQAAAAFGLEPDTVSTRLSRYGWSLEKALTTPAMSPSQAKEQSHWYMGMNLRKK